MPHRPIDSGSHKGSSIDGPLEASGVRLRLLPTGAILLLTDEPLVWSAILDKPVQFDQLPLEVEEPFRCVAPRQRPE